MDTEADEFWREFVLRRARARRRETRCDRL